MTQSTKAARAEPKRWEEEWLTAYRHREDQLRALPDNDLDALVAGTVFQSHELTGVPFSTSWDGFGRLVEHMQAHGYTLLCNAYEPSHLDWINNLPDRLKRGDIYQAAEVTVVGIRRRMLLPESWLNLKVRADTLPRASALAAVLTWQMVQGDVMPLDAPEPAPPLSGWTEERRRRHSEQMKAYWQRRRAEIDQESQP